MQYTTMRPAWVYALAGGLVLLGLCINLLRPLIAQARFRQEAVAAHPDHAGLAREIADAFIAADNEAPDAQRRLQHAAACAGFQDGVGGIQVFGEVGALALQRLDHARLGPALHNLAPDPSLRLATLVCPH